MATTPDSTDSSSGPGTGTPKAGSAGAAKPATKPGAAAAKKAAKSGGRFTPKGAKDQGVVRAGGATGAAAAKPASGRYTPPTAPLEVEAQQLTKPWVAPLMFAFFIIGLLLIVLNYLEAVLPSAPSNWYLLGGIVAISGGFLTATKLY